MFGKKLEVGSTWAKWDLHVHTPSSITQNYGGDNVDNWEKFISDLEKLPAEFKVIGINDYLFLDGYKKVLEFKKNDRLKNIDLILPVLEFRLDMFSGTEEKAKRINIHAIFSNELSPEVIESQFIPAISRSYHLDSEIEGISWDGVLNKKSLSDFGQKIKETSPALKDSKLNNLNIGFDNLCIEPKAFFEALENVYLKGKVITALGKTEWDALRWTGATAGTKKHLINSSDFIFTSSESLEKLSKARETLVNAQVNSRLLDCSDAHSFSDSNNKDHIGKCLTWIKGDFTFEALKYARIEYSQRVFLGDRPPKLEIVDNNKTKYIKNISIRKKANSSLKENWFDLNIPLNPNLVAVIGNKGNGKSALLEILALAGNSKADNHFKFLSANKFRLKPDKSAHFDVEITTFDEKSKIRSLNEASNELEYQMVKFLPQHLLEELCNDIYKTGESEFDRELKDIIFSHVPVDERMGESTLDGLIQFKSKEVLGKIEVHKMHLYELNKELISLEEKRLPSYKTMIESLLNQKKLELAALDEARPVEVNKPTSENGDPSIALKVEELELDCIRLQSEIERLTKRKIDNAILIQNLLNVEAKGKNIVLQAKNFNEEVARLNLGLGKDHDLLVLKFESSVLAERKALLEADNNFINKSLDKDLEGSLTFKLEKNKNLLIEMKLKCDEPNRLYQKFIENLKEWESKKKNLIGDRDHHESIKYFENLIIDWEQIPNVISVKSEERDKVTMSIFEDINELSDTLRKLYKPVQKFSAEHAIIAGKLKLEFDVSITYSTFQEKFIEFIDKSSGGSFHGTEEANKMVSELVDNANFQNNAGLSVFLKSVQSLLYVDKKNNPISVSKQVRKNISVHDLYNFIYGLEYLVPKYTMKLSKKELTQLSPGEKGTLLLVFYLLVDQRDIPLLIDQPEDNLDNHTIYDLLVPSILEAKNKRQVILVTHNPNLAVVCDAEQIISATLEKSEDDTRIIYKTGSIENPDIKDTIVNILEGTKPAFENRSTKYLKITK